MTLCDLLAQVLTAGIQIHRDGDRLRCDAPVGTLTPALRAALTEHKPTLLAALAPSRGLVPLRGGLTVPAEAVELALDLEGRGIVLMVDTDGALVLDRRDPRLSDFDLAAIARWQRHLAALVTYRAPEPIQ